MKTKKLLVVFLLTILLGIQFTGCGASKSSYDQSMPESGYVSNEAPVTDAIAPAASEEAQASYNLTEAYAAPEVFTEQKIIRNAAIDLKVNKAQPVVQQIEKEVELSGGYVASSAQRKRQGDNLSVDMTLRIPSESFAEFMSFLEGLGSVEHKRVYTEDVTEQYIDLSAKIESLTIQEKRLQELLSKATRVEDLLRIEQEIARVRGDLDSYTGQLRYLKNRVAFSTIELTLLETGIEKEELNLGNVDGTWSKSQAAFIASINQLLKMLSSLMVGIFALLPFLLIPGLVIILALVVKYKVYNRKKEKME
ncbi:MAG: DUF4349 domain-containing protein [Zhaonellaceae bacterium]|jgi:hypothetical protein|nr:DUF4349 domain-containing protein [Clostridia bacterium]